MWYIYCIFFSHTHTHTHTHIYTQNTTQLYKRKIVPFAETWMDLGALQVALVVKNPLANTRNIKDTG